MKVEDFEIPIRKAKVIKEGKGIKIISYGRQLRYARSAAAIALEKEGIYCEIIDLSTIPPWDEETVINSVKKAGRCLIAHEARITCGFSAELTAKI